MLEFFGKIFLWIIAILFLIALAVAISALMALFVMWIWNFTVPDVFAGLVEKGLLPATITWLQAFKLSLLLSVLGISARGSSSSSSKS